MAELVSQRIGALANGKDADELRFLLNALVDGVRAIAAKLDADATVTDTDYAATLDGYVTKS